MIHLPVIIFKPRERMDKFLTDTTLSSCFLNPFVNNINMEDVRTSEGRTKLASVYEGFRNVVLW